MNTRPGKLSIIGIHTPIGYRPYHLLKGLWSQYKKFRYNGIVKIAIQPAAQLPADPLQVSLEAGETLDPRDLLNPILFHGAHGTSINAALNVAYKKSGFNFVTDSLDRLDLEATYADIGQPDSEAPVGKALYYSALSDPSFKKFSPQQFIQLDNLTPMVHRLNSSLYWGPNNSNMYAGSNIGTAAENISSEITRASQGTVWDGNQQVSAGADMNKNGLVAFQQFFTNGMAALDWMPTHSLMNHGVAVGDGANRDTLVYPSSLPKLYMGVLILPPSYNQKLYFRMVITHSYSFREFGTYWELSVPGIGYEGQLNEYFNDFDDASTTQTTREQEDLSLNLTEADAILENVGVR